MAQRRAVVVREDRVGHRLEQRHEAGHAAGQRARRDRQSLVGQPCANAVQGTQARIVLEEEARPDAGPVRRVGEQPWHGGCRHLHGRRRALARPAPARAADHTPVGPDLDLDEGGLLGAVGRIGAPASATHARIGRRVMLFRAFFETGPLGAAMAASAGLPASPTPGTWRLLPLALAAEQRLRQHRTGRAKLRQPGFQLPDPPLRCLHGLAETGLLPDQRPDRGLLAPRSAERLAQLGVGARQRLRQRLPDRAQLGQLGLRPLPSGLRRLHGLAQPSDLAGRRLRTPCLGRAQQPGSQAPLRGFGDLQRMAQCSDLVGQRPNRILPVAQSRQLAVDPKDLMQLPAQRVVVSVRLEQDLAKLADLVLPGLQRRHGLAQPRDLHAQCHDRAALARVHTCLPKEIVQTPHLRAQPQCVLRRSTSFPRLLDHHPQLATRRLEARPPRPRIATRRHFRPAQLFRPRLRRLRTSPLLFV